MSDEQMNVTKDVLNNELTRIYERDGKVKASTVLDESRPKTAPLHPAFEWRDKVAAEQYRLEQARRIIRIGRVKENDTLSQLHHVAKRAISNIDADVDGDKEVSSEATREGYYKTAAHIAKNIDEYTLAYEAAQQALLSASKRVQALEAAARAESKPDNELGRIQIALKALATAESALAVH